MEKEGVTGNRNTLGVAYYLESKWTVVRWECPKCGHENREDYDTFDEEQIWYGSPESECEECGFGVVLDEMDYD